MTAQILALIIFLAMFVLIILEVWDRHLITLGCGLLTLVLVFGLGMRSMSAVWETLNVKSIFTTAFWYAAGESSEASSGINWQTIIFITGMMIMVEGMARVGFFRWLCMRLEKAGKIPGHPYFYDLHGIILCTGHVHRQYHGYPVPGSRNHRAFQAPGIQPGSDDPF